MCSYVMNIVISLGGSILLSDFNSAKIKQYVDILRDLRKNHNIVVVTGGGSVARDYISVAKKLGATFIADINLMKLTKAIENAKSNKAPELIDGAKILAKKILAL